MSWFDYAQHDMANLWNGRHVLITGGSSLLGSHFALKFTALGAQVRIPSRHTHLPPHLINDQIEAKTGDLAEPEFCTELLTGIDAVFHLASPASPPVGDS